MNLRKNISVASLFGLTLAGLTFCSAAGFAQAPAPAAAPAVAPAPQAAAGPRGTPIRAAGLAWKPASIAYIKASNAKNFNQLGIIVAMSGDGNTMAVSSTVEDSGAKGINGNQADHSAISSGAVYVFVRNGGAWAQQAYVKASNSQKSDQFGSSIALSNDGNTMAVGAIGESSSATGVDGNQADNSMPGAGAVYVFTRAGTTWTQQSYLKASNTGEKSDGDQFGYSAGLERRWQHAGHRRNFRR